MPKNFNNSANSSMQGSKSNQFYKNKLEQSQKRNNSSLNSAAKGLIDCNQILPRKNSKSFMPIFKQQMRNNNIDYSKMPNKLIFMNENHTKPAKNKMNIKRKLNEARLNLQTNSTSILSPPNSKGIASYNNSTRNQITSRPHIESGNMTSRQSKMQAEHPSYGNHQTKHIKGKQNVQAMKKSYN